MISGLHIRKIERSDNEALAGIIRTIFEQMDLPKTGTVYNDPTTDNLFELFQTPRSVCFVAELDNQVVGSGGVYPTEGLPEGCCEFSKFYISSEARGRGIGKLLLSYCLSAAKDLKYSRVYLESFPQFTVAINMYQKAGFRTLKAPLGNSGHYSCSVWLDMNI